MSQQEILDLLKKYPEGLTLKEICQKIKKNKATVDRNLQRLLKSKDIKYEETQARIFVDGRCVIKNIRVYKLNKEQKNFFSKLVTKFIKKLF